MKTLIKYAVITLTVTMALCILPTEAEGEIYEDTLRLHILANSDSTEDQTLKISIRDMLLKKYATILKDGKSISDSQEKVEALLPEIEKDVEKWISDMGYSYSAEATFTREWYDTREYEDFTLPCGYYDSLRIIIGEGEGKNWWCVMYPPLCLDMATEGAPADDGVIDYSKEEISLIKNGKYQVKFKILEDLSRLFAKNG